MDKAPIDSDGYKTHGRTFRRKHYCVLKVKVWCS